MATMTYQAQLEEVQAAITRVMSAQGYSVSSDAGTGMSVNRASLAALEAREKYLIRMVAREARGGIKVIGATPV